jgi:hypothetical protein
VPFMGNNESSPPPPVLPRNLVHCACTGEKRYEMYFRSKHVSFVYTAGTVCSVLEASVFSVLMPKVVKPRSPKPTLNKDLLTPKRLSQKCETCGKGAGFGPRGTKLRIRCKVHMKPGDVDVVNKRCEWIGCDKQPSFGKPESGPERCKAHKKFDDVDVKNKRCEWTGCDKHPTFGKRGSRAERCKVHKKDDDVDVVSKRCTEPGCDKKPTFGKHGSGRAGAQRCKVHMKFDDVDVKNKRCMESGCDKQPTFGKRGSGAERCKAHMKNGDVDVVSKRCEWTGCDKRPIFGESGSGSAGAVRCKVHMKSDDVDVVDKRCVQPGCGVRAWWGVAGNLPDRCAEHADRKVMISNPRRKCMKCSEVGMAEYKGMRFCEDHAPAGSIQFIQLPCSSCGLEALLIDGLCEYCDPGRQERVRKMKEEGVAWALSEAGLHVVARDKILENDYGCVRTRPDFQLLGMEGKWWVYVECDEYQHEHITPECEEVRMRNLAEVRGQPVMFIRFNPDVYKSKYQMSTKKRYPTLVHWVRWAIENGPAGFKDGATVVVLKLFYDRYDPEHPDMATLV